MLLNDHQQHSEKISQSADQGQQADALQTYAEHLREAGAHDEACLVKAYRVVKEFHSSEIKLSHRINYALMSLSKNRVGGFLSEFFENPDDIWLYLTFFRAMPRPDSSGDYLYCDDMDEESVEWVNQLFQPLTITAERMIERTGYPLLYSPDPEPCRFIFDFWQIPFIADYLEGLA